MAAPIWVQHDEESLSPTEYADRGRFRAMIVRHDESEGRTIPGTPRASTAGPRCCNLTPVRPAVLRPRPPRRVCT
jgi:hypothetical protein